MLFVVKLVVLEFCIVEILGWINYDRVWKIGELFGYDFEGIWLIVEEYFKFVVDWKG